jgi:predicted nucleic acid-binding protein
MGKGSDIMKKLRIYLDTSVISYLLEDDTPEKMDDTQELWKLLQQDEYEIIISNVTLEELEGCNTEKRDILAKYMELINYSFALITLQEDELAEKYLIYNVLSEKNRTDLTHIACAVLNDCDYIISWNFKHFVNIKTINKVNAVNLLLGYREIKIISPSMLL